MAEIQRIPPRPDLQPVDGFDALARVTLLGLESAASQRVYRQTFNAWADWCLQNGSEPLDLRPGQVVAFLADGDTTKATRQRQLSALRKLAQMLYILDPSDDHRLIYGDAEQAALVLAPHTAYVERTNLTSRQMTGRLVRKTLGFSKRLALLRAACAWEDLVYNWTRPVKTLRLPANDGTPLAPALTGDGRWPDGSAVVS